MTIVTGPEDQNSKAPSSPPTYAEVAAAEPRQTQRPLQPINGVPATLPYSAQSLLPQPTPQPPHGAMSGPPPPPPSQRVYGPTPLAASQSAMTTVLPYYDPRSPWAMEAAASRARRRFFGALLWAFVIWLAIGSLVGGVVDDAGRRRVVGGGGTWAIE